MMLTKLAERFGNVVKVFKGDNGVNFFGFGSRARPDAAVFSHKSAKSIASKDIKVTEYTQEDMAKGHDIVMKVFLGLLDIQNGITVEVSVDSLIATLEAVSSDTVSLTINPTAHEVLNPLDDKGARIPDTTHKYGALVIQDRKSEDVAGLLGVVASYSTPPLLFGGKDAYSVYKGMVTYVDDVLDPKRRVTIPYGEAPVFGDDEDDNFLDDDEDDFLDDEELGDGEDNEDEDDLLL
jgi:hypothetical protein